MNASFYTQGTREDDPDLGARVPGPAAIIAEERRDLEPGLLEAASHLWDRKGPERERKAVDTSMPPTTLGELLIEDRPPTRAVLPHRFHERHVGSPAAAAPPFQA